MPAQQNAVPVEATRAPVAAHALSGVPMRLSISLDNLARLDEPPAAGRAVVPCVVASPTVATTTVGSPPSSEGETTPDEDTRTGVAPWKAAHDDGRPAPTVVVAASAVTRAAEGAVVAGGPFEEEEAADAEDDGLEDGGKAGDGNPKSAVRKQAWTAAEDAKLLELVERHGPANWSRIAADLPSRIGKQCRERWHNHLSPAVKKEGFSPEEDMAIMRAVAEHGTKWAHIVKLIPGRTDNAIKNRWNSTTRKMVRVQRRCGDQVPGLADVDLNAMDAAAVAKHLLAHGVTAENAAPPKPPAKRRLSLPKEGKAAKDGGEEEDGGEEGTSGKRSKARRKDKKPAADGLALLRAATFRTATIALVEAADALSDGSEGTEGTEGAEATEGMEQHEGTSVPVWPPAGSSLAASPTLAPAQPHAADAPAAAPAFALDALSLLAESSTEVAACRSPRMLEAAIALGGAFGESSPQLALA